jgi:catechol 2,3-dioxygenase
VATRPVLHHVNLKTTRLQAMIDWYAAVIGSEVVFQNEVAAWLSNDGANHRIALLAFPGYRDDPDKEHSTGIHHTAYEFASFHELITTYARLRDEGITPVACLDHGMTTSLYFRDPDGNRVELQTDNFGDWEQSREFMLTAPEFEANPIGVFFDPGAVLAAYEAGADFDEIHRRASAGEFLPDCVPDMGIPDPA